MKKSIIFVLFLVLSLYCININVNACTSPEGQYLMEYSDYENIVPDNINELKIIRYTEGGAAEKIIKDKAQIKEFYNMLKQIKIGSKTTCGCTDNTTIYSFKLNDNSIQQIEIECDWVIIKNQNYLIKK